MKNDKEEEREKANENEPKKEQIETKKHQTKDKKELNKKHQTKDKKELNKKHQTKDQKELNKKDQTKDQKEPNKNDQTKDQKEPNKNELKDNDEINQNQNQKELKDNKNIAQNPNEENKTKENDHYLDELKNEINICKEKHKYEECLSIIQNNISKITDKYSKESKEYYSISKEIVEIMNLLALEYYNEGNYKESIKYYEKCILLFQNYKPILHLCYNNLANFYKKININDKALIYYDNAIKISSELHNKKNVAESHINYSIILFTMNKYKLSLEQSLAGIVLLQEKLLELKIPNNNTSNNTSSSNNFIDEDDIDIFSMLENAYILVALNHFKLGDMFRSIFYYDIANQIKNNNENSENKNNILSDDAKLKMLKECLFDINKDKTIDNNEKMANAYIKDKISQMIRDIENKNGWNNSPTIETKEYEQMDQLERFQALYNNYKNNK